MGVLTIDKNVPLNMFKWKPKLINYQDTNKYIVWDQ